MKALSIQRDREVLKAEVLFLSVEDIGMKIEGGPV
jgi:hypothetical protein